MTLTYNGVDITASVEMAEAVSIDCEGGQADMLRLTLQNAGEWYAWGPKEDDEIELVDEGYTTGRMYLHTLLPDGDGFKLVACSLNSAAREPRWACYEQVTLSEMMRQAAAESGMDFMAYGVNLSERYTRLMRKDESLPAMLDRLLTLEGARLKCAGGRMTAISLAWAQARDPVRTFTATPESEAMQHIRGSAAPARSVRVRTATANGMVIYQAQTGHDIIRCDLPATDNAQAARWASGIAADETRDAEEIIWEIDYDGQLCAWARVDIDGLQSVAGEWIAREVEHDHIERKTTMRLCRCVEIL